MARLVLNSAFPAPRRRRNRSHNGPLYPTDQPIHIQIESDSAPDELPLDEATDTSHRRPQLWETERLPPRPIFKMTQAAYHAVMADLASQPFTREEGGILLGPDDAPDLVVRYVKDEQGVSRPASFTIDALYLNRQIKKVRSAGLTCAGIVHSHPDGIAYPSSGDIEFLMSIFSHPGNGGEMFLFPIICCGRFHPYVVDTANIRRIVSAELVLI